MRKHYFFYILLFTTITIGAIGTPSKAKVIYSSNSVNVPPVAFTVPSVGWYRVGELTRGLIKVAVSISGGAHKPQNLVIEAYKDWGSGLFLRAEGSTNNYITQVRLTYEAGKYYIEIYVTRALTQNAYFYHYETEGYAGLFTPNSGVLPDGDGEVKKQSGYIYNSSYTSGNTLVYGNVGIGTSSPLVKLDVIGGDIQVSNAGHFKGWTTSGLTGLGLDVGISNGKGYIMAYDRTNSQYADLRISSGGESGITLLKNGNVGIGTISPDTRLTVKGTIHSEEIRVEVVNPPDYVFDESYDLPTLSETEAYIKQNHHLPEVPSAADMQTNGVELGKMNMLLLQKIEEMTLHQIEMNKLLLKQQREIDKLKSYIK